MVTADTLLRGSWLALEQAGLLLRDSVLLDDIGSCSSAVGLALLGREELGRYAILCELWAEVAAGRAAVSAKQVRARCENHLQKQTRGMFSTVLRVPGNSKLGALFRDVMGRLSSSVSDPARVAAIDSAMSAVRKRTPSDRHLQRMRAFYVDIADDETSWHRPAEFSSWQAVDVISDAVNDYAVQRDRLTTEGVREHVAPAFAAALDAWADKPELIPPTWPKRQVVVPALDR